MKTIQTSLFILVACMHILTHAMQLPAQKNEPKFNIVTVQSKDPGIEYEIWELPNNEFDQDTITFIQKKIAEHLVTTAVEIYTTNNQIYTYKNKISEIEFVLDNPHEALAANREFFELDIEEPCHVYRDEAYRNRKNYHSTPQLASNIISDHRKIIPSCKPANQSWAYYLLNAMLNSD
ncbi:hypothetical protein [Candidatus Chromulinivorax destructor]|uniref:Uncharacterized protein n=1 Tax=Candidatus Chromulinivorax destructor TaxID=2066483 RepID=A0A345ZAM7_9BACT|nr:hypothetical protein [Candidatus Chromulinivorax destructor]AXK60344.1 hypothetical protein C0J27_01085 [Candidatus Chromulinivorax destructor]